MCNPGPEPNGWKPFQKLFVRLLHFTHKGVLASERLLSKGEADGVRGSGVWKGGAAVEAGCTQSWSLKVLDLV